MMAVMPAVRLGGAAVARQMPGLVTRLTKYAPSAATALAKYTGSVSPTALAASISKSGNGLQAQALMFNALKAGASAETIRGAVPLLTDADLLMMTNHHIEYVNEDRRASDAVALVPNHANPEFTAPTAETVLQIEQTCKALYVTSEQLVDVIAAMKILTSVSVKNYRGYMMKTGKPYV